MNTKSLTELLNPTVEPATLHCPMHGEYIGEIRRVWNQAITTACPLCAAERAAEEERQAEARVAEERRRARAHRYRTAGLPLRFWERDFEGYCARTMAQRKTLTTVRRYAEHFATLAERGTCLLLCGGPVTGVRALLRDLRETWRPEHPERERDLMERLVRYDLLILDEVGMQFGSDAERLLLFDVLNGRYEELKPTVLISNLIVGELPDYLGERLMDRLRENGGVVAPFTWGSERGLKVVA